MADMVKSSGSLASLRRQEAAEARVLFAASFVIFLTVATVARFLPPQWRPFPPGANGQGSVIAEARAAASTFVPFVFMG